MIKYIWYVKNVNLFEKVSDYEIRLLRSRSKLKEYKRYDLVCDKSTVSSSVYIVKDGSIKIYEPDREEDKSKLSQSTVLPKEKEFEQEKYEFTNNNDIFSQLLDTETSNDNEKQLKQIPVTLKSGEFFGVINKETEIEDFVVECMEDSEIYITNKSTIKLLFKYLSNRTIKIEKSSKSCKYQIENRIQDLIDKDVVSRLASLLLVLSERYSKWETPKAVLEFRLSNKELSKLIGATIEDVSQVLEWIENEEIISKRRRKLEILNIWKLKKIAKNGKYRKILERNNSIEKQN